MTTLFPHSSYAEDQPYAKSILRFHVLLRGLNMGAILAVPTALTSTLIWGPRVLPVFTNRLFIHSYRGTVGGLIFGVLAVEGRMFGREDIEWKDRSWRLLGSKGQVEVDNWTLIGGAVGALVGARRGRVSASLGQRMVSGMGFGTVIGSMCYM
jgi:hypothetical protein